MEFLNEKNQELKNEIISLLLEGKNIELINSHIDKNYSSIINEISSNSNIQIISKTKKTMRLRSCSTN